MKKKTWITLAACVLGLAAGDVSAGGGQWSIVQTFPIPEGPSGLAYDGTWLYCGIYPSGAGDLPAFPHGVGAG